MIKESLLRSLGGPDRPESPRRWRAPAETFPAETFVVFPGRIFRYPRGDDVGRAEAETHGRQLAIPESQLDWPV